MRTIFHFLSRTGTKNPKSSVHNMRTPMLPDQFFLADKPDFPSSPNVRFGSNTNQVTPKQRHCRLGECANTNERMIENRKESEPDVRGLSLPSQRFFLRGLNSNRCTSAHVTATVLTP